MIDEDRTAILQGAISYGSETGLMGTLSLKDNNWKGRAQEFGVNFENQIRTIQDLRLTSLILGFEIPIESLGDGVYIKHPMEIVTVPYSMISTPSEQNQCRKRICKKLAFQFRIKGRICKRKGE